MTKLIGIFIGIGVVLFVVSTAIQLDLPDVGQPPKKIEASFRQLLDEVTKSEETIRLRGEDRDQINFLFLGIGGEEHISGNYLTDTIILVIFVPSTQKTAAISIPRDLLVRSPEGTYFMRINALYAIPSTRSARSGQAPSLFPGPMGVEYTKDTIKNITGVTPDYYAVLDLAGVEKIVDILGGVNIRRFDDLEDNYFPDDNYGYETYEINEGWRYLNGETATKYIRTRHTAGGDFDRMRRQQEVALAVKKKVTGLQSLSGLPKLFSLYQALQDHFTTDLTFNEIMHLVDLGEELGGEEIIFERITAEKDGLLIPNTVLWNGIEAYILEPRAGTENYEEIKAKISGVIDSLKNSHE